MIALTLPYPPSVNSLYANIPGKGRVKTERYRSWERVAQTEIMAQRSQFPVKHIAGPVAISITLEDRRKSIDIDNGVKGLVDCCVAMGLMDDDRNVRQILVKKDETGSVKGCVVTIEAADQARAA